jgi:hypothetical protein
LHREFECFGKLVYPAFAAWRAKRQARQISAVFTVSVVFGLIASAMIYL